MSYRSPAVTALYRVIIWPAEALLLFICVGILRCIPPALASSFMGWLFCLIGPLTPWHSRALTNMRFAMPHLTETKYRKIAHSMWNNIGRCIGEYLHIRSLLSSGQIQYDGLEKLMGHEGGFIIGAHLANWESIGIIGVVADIRTGLIYRELNNPYANWIFKSRDVSTRADSYTKGREGAMGMVRTVKKGGFMIMFVDQQLREGEIVPFFGHPATTAISYIKVARKLRKPIFMARGIRISGHKLSVSISDPLLLPAGDDHETTLKIAKQINQTFEDWILATPEQWLWPHRRWGKFVADSKP